MYLTAQIVYANAECDSYKALWSGILDSIINSNSSCHSVYYLDTVQKRESQPAGASISVLLLHQKFIYLFFSLEEELEIKLENSS